ncbi:phosphatase PAP2 family protein [Martelella sp. HB161492]|uniref:phosphatase PAP2 family protein n=1 Tax=Martelella sp. HB161492 TaxID=2720726 RepID=UPI00158FBF55|nr:phosphatase PAP2 family protein [Martelella sp. HB161492]
MPIWFSPQRRRSCLSAGKARICWRLCLFATLAAVLLAFAVFDEPLVCTRQNLSPLVMRYGQVASGFGNSSWMIIGSLLLLLAAGAGWRLAADRRTQAKAIFLAQAATYFLIAIVGSGITVNVIKRVIGRARPSEFTQYGLLHFEPVAFNSHFASFPSGHAATVGAFFAALSFFFPRYRVMFFMAAVWLAISRVIVGAHYPSDIVAGLAYGAWFSYALAVVFVRHRVLFNLNAGGYPVPRPGLVLLMTGRHRRAFGPVSKTYLDLGAQRGH